MNRGDIYFIKNTKLENGCAQMPDRPAVIVSNDMLNATRTTMLVCYLTLNPQGELPTHVTCRSTGKVSTILCEQVCSVHISKIGQKAGELTETEMRAVDAALAISLGIDFDDAEPRIVEKPVEKIVEKVVMREPTEEELYELARKRVEIMIDEPKFLDNSINLETRLARVEAERDVYHTLYNALLNRLMGFAVGACQ